MCCLHEVYNEKGSFWGYLLTIQNGCPTVKAFHRMNLNQNKCLNSNTAIPISQDSIITDKVRAVNHYLGYSQPKVNSQSEPSPTSYLTK